MSNDPTIPSFSTRLWSEEVGMADPAANFDARPVLAYGFGGRTFVTDVNSTLYAPRDDLPPELTLSVVTRQVQFVAADAAVTSENIVTDASAASMQAQLVAAVFGVDGVDPQLDADVATRQRQHSALQVTITSENLATNSTATSRQAQKTQVGIALNGANPPIAGAVTTRQAQYAASVMGIDGKLPGSEDPIPLGSEITTLKIENTAATPVTNAPFYLGHAFASGHLPSAGANVALVQPDGTSVPAQFTVKAKHADGSVRHAILCGVMPSLAASSSQTLSIRRAASPPGLPAVAMPATLPVAQLVIAGATWTASCAGAAYDTWLAGPVASDFIFNVPFVGAAGPHPTLTAQFSVRVFSSGQVRVDATVEHTKAYLSTTDITYDVTLKAGATTYYSKTGLTHTPTGRWKKTFWIGQAPTLHVRHDTAYLIASKLVPNYDQSITFPESELASYDTWLTGGTYEPMKFGRFTPYMPTTGGRSDIGIMPDTHVAAILTMDRRAKAIVLAAGDIAGSWPICRRDDSSGPGRGLPLSTRNFPYACILGNPGDALNPATGKNEKLPDLTTVTQGVVDCAHQPGICYLPYLLSGDYFYLEQLQFFATYDMYFGNPYYREFGKSLVHPDQVRGQAWSMRTIAQAAAITPDDHYLKSHFTTCYADNIAWYVAKYVDGNSNPLGVIEDQALAYNINGGSANGLACWQDDFFTMSIGHGVELLGNSEAKRLLDWKAKFQVGRMLDPAICVQDSCAYSLGVKTTSSAPMFPTLAQCWQFTIPASQAQYPCDSPQRLATAGSPLLPGDIDGYPDSTVGFAADYQPALAFTVDAGYPGGLTAWNKFQSRPTKPNYGYGAQFAVVPRLAQTAKAPLLDLTVKTNHRQSSTGALAITATPSTASTRQAQRAALLGGTGISASAATTQGQRAALLGSYENLSNVTTKQGQRAQAAVAKSSSGLAMTKQAQSVQAAIVASSAGSSVTYTASTADFANPERGLYVHLLHTGDFSAANLNQYKAQNMSLVLYQAYLSSYKTAALDATFLNAFQSHLDSIRSLGMKAILRFAYTSTDTADATLTRIQGHLDQLAPYLSANDDVIFGMQAGFVGRWGEFQGSNNFGADSWPPNLSDANRQLRKAVVDKALAVMPAHRWVQVRQPWIKMYNTGNTPVSSSTAFDGSARSRVGHFNDCFLSGPDDSGTYYDQPTEEAFLAADTLYVPMGGETCTYNEPRSSGATAIAEMTRFHWTFINSGYQDLVIQSWKDSGDYATISKRLGYRLALTTGSYPTVGTRGTSINVAFSVNNSGFAAPVSGRTVYLVLRNTTTGAETRLALGTDPRTWLAGTTTDVNETLLLPAGMAAGSYALFLALPDADATLAANPAYAIRLANTGLWEAATGYNALNHTITVV
jgi:hypothetical protein